MVSLIILINVSTILTIIQPDLPYLTNDHTFVVVSDHENGSLKY